MKTHTGVRAAGIGTILVGRRSALTAADREDELKTAEYLSVHAPTNLHPDGPQWWERAPVISRLITLYDRLRDFPKARERN